MIHKILGVILIVLGCGGCGFTMAACYRYEENCLRQLQKAMDFMACELEYRQPELPQLCVHTANAVTGVVRQLFTLLSRELEQQVAPDAQWCMDAALAAVRLPDSCRLVARELGDTLGLFDLNGQLRGLRAAEESCAQKLSRMSAGRESRLRNYQTLGLCAGAALAILLL